MKNFILKLLSDNNIVSSKRLISLFGLLLLVSFLVVDWCGIGTKEYQFWGIISLVLGGNTLTLLSKKPL